MFLKIWISFFFVFTVARFDKSSCIIEIRMVMMKEVIVMVLIMLYNVHDDDDDDDSNTNY